MPDSVKPGHQRRAAQHPLHVGGTKLISPIMHTPAVSVATLRQADQLVVPQLQVHQRVRRAALLPDEHDQRDRREPNSGSTAAPAPTRGSA